MALLGINKKQLIGFVIIMALILSGCSIKVESLKSYRLRTQQESDLAMSERTTHRKNAEELRQEWKLVSNFAMIRMVYMSPPGLKDKDYIAQVLAQLVNKKDSIQVLFFDNKKYTPLKYPMTDKQMLHWKADYSFNPNTGHEKFVFIEITNPNASPPGLKYIEAKIKPGYTSTISERTTHRKNAEELRYEELPSEFKDYLEKENLDWLWYDGE